MPNHSKCDLLHNHAIRTDYRRTMKDNSCRVRQYQTIAKFYVRVNFRRCDNAPKDVANARGSTA